MPDKHNYIIVSCAGRGRDQIVTEFKRALEVLGIRSLISEQADQTPGTIQAAAKKHSEDSAAISSTRTIMTAESQEQAVN